MKKVMFISSTGGHLTELMQLKRIFSNYDYHIVTEKTKINLAMKKEYGNRISFLTYGTKHNMITYAFIFPINCIHSLIKFIKYRPNVIVTTGAHTAVPMCYIAKLFRRKVIFIETFANIHTKTVSGRLVYPIADVFIVQWKSMLDLYPNATFGGWIF